MKKLPEVEQIRQWDAFTIAQTPIASIDLMERAARSCVDWLFRNGFGGRCFSVVCGTGNNGGDGLAIARILAQAGCPIDFVACFGDATKGSADFRQNLERLKARFPAIPIIHNPQQLDPMDLCIDALFGTGLTRGVEGPFKSAIESINTAAKTLISIDIPSGLPANPRAFLPTTATDADHILSFQQWKETFFHAKPTLKLQRTAKVHVLDIGLLEDFLASMPARAYTFDRSDARELLRPRKRFTHKGSYGAAFIAGGSAAMPGAAVLAVNSALKSGCGLVFGQVPASIRQTVQIAAHGAMVDSDPHNKVLSLPSIQPKTTAIGCGPGMGTGPEQREFLYHLLSDPRPIVIDADGLNLIAADSVLYQKMAVHGNCVVTPHPAEFDRLFGEHNSLAERLETAVDRAVELKLVIHLKGSYSVTVTADGRIIYHTTGSASMAVGGSGDVLTGLLTGLLASGYSRAEAALLAASVHGTAGELYERDFGCSGLSPDALIELIPNAWHVVSEEA